MSFRKILTIAFRVCIGLFVCGLTIAGMTSLAEGKDYLTYCKDAHTSSDIRYTIDALQEFVGSSDCDRSFELLNRRAIITIKNKQLKTVEPIGSLTYAQKLELIEGDHKLPPCSPTAVKPPRGLDTLAGMSGLMEIRIENYNLTSVAFLRQMQGLLKVDVTCNQITDISPAAAIKSLQQLVAPYNRIAKLPSFAGLPELEWVKFNHNAIAEAASFAGISRLERIELSHNKLTAFPRSDFVFYLDVAHNQIAGGSHPGAGYLRVSGNQLSSLSFVGNPGKVSELAIGGNKLKSLSGLSAFTKLYSLDLSGNPLGPISANDIPSARLDGLAINGVGLKAMPDFSGFPQLRKLAMADNQLSRFEQAKLPPQLVSLSIKGNQLSELTLTNRPLTSLNASYNKISTLSFSCPGTELETLINLDGNPLAGAPRISDCPLLSGFSARNTGLKDVGFLAQVLDLWRVDLGDNPISNLMPLKDLERIAVIALDGTLLDKPGAKNASNCPQDALSKVLADWCTDAD